MLMERFRFQKKKYSILISGLESVQSFGLLRDLLGAGYNPESSTTFIQGRHGGYMDLRKNGQSFHALNEFYRRG
jgi:hypothetical protein